MPRRRNRQQQELFETAPTTPTPKARRIRPPSDKQFSDPARLLIWYRRSFPERNSESDRISALGMAAYALRKGRKPAALFYTLALKNATDCISLADDDQAAAWRRSIDSGPPEGRYIAAVVAIAELFAVHQSISIPRPEPYLL